MRGVASKNRKTFCRLCSPVTISYFIKIFSYFCRKNNEKSMKVTGYHKCEELTTRK